MRILLVLLGLLVSGTAEAIDCNTPPSCESLGYAKADDLDCETDGYLNCPFDTSYKKCVTHNCEKLGFTKDDKTSWCSNIIKCNADTNYTLCECMKSRCEIGDVFYADGSCGKVDAYVKDSSPQPVGVVYSLTCSGGGKVINLHDLGRASSNANFDPQKPYDTYKDFTWGVYGTDISGLTNWICSGSDNNYLTVAKTGDHSHPFWSAGESYTDLIVKALGNSNLQYPAGAAHAFYPPEVSENDPKVGKGKWYLPTLGELMDLYGYNYTSDLGYCESSTGATGTTKSTVNATLQALKDKGAGNAEKLASNGYWSSSERTKDLSWLLLMNDGGRYSNVKNHLRYVRASLEFY